MSAAYCSVLTISRVATCCCICKLRCDSAPSPDTGHVMHADSLCTVTPQLVFVSCAERLHTLRPWRRRSWTAHAAAPTSQPGPCLILGCPWLTNAASVTARPSWRASCMQTCRAGRWQQTRRWVHEGHCKVASRLPPGCCLGFRWSCLGVLNS